MIELLKDEELIKKTKPHSTSFLSSSIFWIGIITVVISIYGILVHIANLIVVSLLIVGFVLIALGDLRRVWAHTYYITNK